MNKTIQEQWEDFKANVSIEIQPCIYQKSWEIYLDCYGYYEGEELIYRFENSFPSTSRFELDRVKTNMFNLYLKKQNEEEK